MFKISSDDYSKMDTNHVRNDHICLWKDTAVIQKCHLYPPFGNQVYCKVRLTLPIRASVHTVQNKCSHSYLQNNFAKGVMNYHDQICQIAT